MKIWSLEEDVNHYEHITLDDRNNLNWIDFGDMFNGKSLKDNWTPIRVCLIEHGGKLKKEICRIYHLVNLFSPKVQ